MIDLSRVTMTDQYPATSAKNVVTQLKPPVILLLIADVKVMIQS